MEYLSIPHYRGLKEKYDEQKHGDGIFFTTDTHEIIANNATYGETIDTWSIADGVLTLTMTSGKTLEITFDEATESAKGFLSAEDKKKINSLEGNFDKRQIKSLENLQQMILKLTSYLISLIRLIQILPQPTLKSRNRCSD